MRKLLLIPACLTFIIGFNTGCQKEISPAILKDSTGVNIPVLRQIQVHSVSSVNPFSLIFSIQYDTINRKINFYSDDTTTSTPYDRLVYSYQFNPDGYLISADVLDSNGTFGPDFTISRNNTNQIQKIVEYNSEILNGTSYNDTVYYSYSTSGNQMMVQDSVRFHDQQNFLTEKSVFNSQNKLVSANYFYAGLPDGTENYTYNLQGGVSKIVTDLDTTEFTYDNITPSHWQNMPLIFLGKDYYLLQQEALTNRLNYQFLTVIIETAFETIYNPLLSMPVKQVVRHGHSFLDPTFYQSKTINFTNSFTTGNLLSSVSILPEGDDPIYYSFKYQ